VMDSETVPQAAFWVALDAAVARFGEAMLDVPPPCVGPVTLAELRTLLPVTRYDAEPPPPPTFDEVEGESESARRTRHATLRIQETINKATRGMTPAQRAAAKAAAYDTLMTTMNSAFQHATVFSGPAGVAEAKRLMPARATTGVTFTLMKSRVTGGVLGGYARGVTGCFLWYWGVRPAEGRRPTWFQVYRNPAENTRHGRASDRLVVREGKRMQDWAKK